MIYLQRNKTENFTQNSKDGLDKITEKTKSCNKGSFEWWITNKVQAQHCRLCANFSGGVTVRVDLQPPDLKGEITTSLRVLKRST